MFTVIGQTALDPVKVQQGMQIAPVPPISGSPGKRKTAGKTIMSSGDFFGPIAGGDYAIVTGLGKRRLRGFEPAHPGGVRGVAADGAGLCAPGGSRKQPAGHLQMMPLQPALEIRQEFRHQIHQAGPGHAGSPVGQRHA